MSFFLTSFWVLRSFNKETLCLNFLLRAGSIHRILPLKSKNVCYTMKNVYAGENISYKQ